MVSETTIQIHPMKMTNSFTAQLKHHISCVITGSILCSGLTVIAQDDLPPDVQADRYLLAAQAKMKAGENAAAADYFTKIVALKVPVPVEFHFYYGKCLAQSQNYDQATQELTAYLKAAGRDGKSYQEALQLLNTSTEGKERQDAQQAKANQAKEAKYARVQALKRALANVKDGSVNYTEGQSEFDESWYFTTSGHSTSVKISLYQNSLNPDSQYSSGTVDMDFAIDDVSEVSWDNKIVLKHSIQVRKSLMPAFRPSGPTAQEKKLTDSTSTIGCSRAYQLASAVKDALQIQKDYSDITEEDIQEYDRAVSEQNRPRQQSSQNGSSQDGMFVNSLGMKFVAVPGTSVKFSIWDTRVQDFEAFVKDTRYDATGGMDSLRKGEWGQHGDTWKSPGFSQEATHPVVGVSWGDAKAFCKWLSVKEGKTYRLPTCEEWHVALDKKEGIFPWGTNWPPAEKLGNYAGSEVKDADWPTDELPIENYHDDFARTAPVGGSGAAKKTV